MEIIGVRAAAESLGCTVRTVSRNCKRYGIGTLVSGVWMLTPEELQELKAVVRPQRGNPHFVAGNYFGRERSNA